MHRKPEYIWQENNYSMQKIPYLAMLEASVQQKSLRKQSYYVLVLNMGICPTKGICPMWGFAQPQALPKQWLLPSLSIHPIKRSWPNRAFS